MSDTVSINDLIEDLSKPKMNSKFERAMLVGLGDLSLMIPCGDVTQIIDDPDYIKIPGVKEFVVGGITFDGRLIPLIDLQLLAGCVHKSAKDNQAAVIIQTTTKTIGFIVNAMPRVVDLGEYEVVDYKGDLPASIRDCLIGAVSEIGDMEQVKSFLINTNNLIEHGAASELELK